MANFLHFGTAHIVMNMLGLLVPGPFVEFLLGRLTYVAVCLLAGLATMASVGALMAYRGEPDDILIGASGAIMALIGATAAGAAPRLTAWPRERRRPTTTHDRPHPPDAGGVRSFHPTSKRLRPSHRRGMGICDGMRYPAPTA